MSYRTNPFMSPIAKAFAAEQDKRCKKGKIMAKIKATKIKRAVRERDDFAGLPFIKSEAKTVSFKWHEEQVDLLIKELDLSNTTVREKNNKLTDTLNKVDKLEEEIKHLKFALTATVLCLTD